MSKRVAATCEDCYFRQAGLCALPGNAPCPTFRAAATGHLEPPPQPRLVILRVMLAALDRPAPRLEPPHAAVDDPVHACGCVRATVDVHHPLELFDEVVVARRGDLAQPGDLDGHVRTSGVGGRPS